MGHSDAENVWSGYSADLEMNVDNIKMAFKDAVSVTWMYPNHGKTQEWAFTLHNRNTNF